MFFFRCVQELIPLDREFYFSIRYEIQKNAVQQVLSFLAMNKRVLARIHTQSRV